MVKKSRSSHHEATAEEISTEAVTEEDSEVVIEMADSEEEIMDSEVEMTEDPEETSVTDQRDVSTAVKKVISPETAKNVIICF